MSTFFLLSIFGVFAISALLLGAAMILMSRRGSAK